MSWSLLTLLEARASNRALTDRVRGIVNRLRAIGVQPGDTVLYAVRPTPSSIPLALAVMESGAVLIAAPIGEGQSVFDAQMTLASPDWVIAESAVIAAGRNSATRWLLGRLGARLPSFRTLTDARFARVGPWIPGVGDSVALDPDTPVATHCEPNGRSAEDAMMVVFTSGTTASPKAVVHTWRSVQATLDVISGQLGVREGDVMYARELHLMLPALVAGARVVMPTFRQFTPERLLADLTRFGVTHTFSVTAEWQALIDHLERARVSLPSTLHRVLIGAAPVRAPFLRRLRDVLPAGATASCVYGMTEILPIATVTIDEKLAWNGEGDLVGTTVPGVDARIAPDGELIVRGPHLFAGYLGQPTIGEHATGDLARIEHGRVVLLGRKKDMIIRGQRNIYPELYEPVIERIPGVRRAAMVGVFDESAADERVVLFVEPDNGGSPGLAARVQEELRSGTSQIDVAALPDHIVLAEIPLAGRSSKVDKSALRAMARETVGCA